MVRQRADGVFPDSVVRADEEEPEVRAAPAGADVWAGECRRHRRRCRGNRRWEAECLAVEWEADFGDRTEDFLAVVPAAAAVWAHSSC